MDKILYNDKGDFWTFSEREVNDYRYRDDREYLSYDFGEYCKVVGVKVNINWEKVNLVGDVVGKYLAFIISPYYLYIYYNGDFDMNKMRELGIYEDVDVFMSIEEWIIKEIIE